MDGFQWDFGKPEQALQWTEETLVNVGLDFLRIVLVNMREKTSTVKFDKQHNNYRPNYQIKFVSGLHQLFDGISHEPLQQLEKSALTNFSDEFDFSQIRVAYDHLIAEVKR